MKRSRLFVMSLVVIAAAVTGQNAIAATIASGDFSIGFGFTGADNPQAGFAGLWDTTETAAFNTPTTIGDFSFLPVLEGRRDSTAGVVFTGRTLASGGGYSGLSWGHTASAAYAPPTITASYNGPTPGDAAVVPNYQLTLEITSISIYVGGPTPGSVMAWDEITAGHEATSSSVVTPAPGGFDNVSSYVQLAWDPGDFSVAGTSSTRIFTLLNPAEVATEGFEVEGRVILTYDAIPEPGAISLLGLGSFMILFARFRRYQCG